MPAPPEEEQPVVADPEPDNATENETLTAPGKAQELLKDPGGATLAEGFIEQIRQGYVRDPEVARYITRLEAGENNDWEKQGELWYKDQALVIPRHNSLRQECIEKHHDPPTRGHPCANRTLKAIQEYYWWPKMTADVKKYVATCYICQLTTPGRYKQAGMLQAMEIPPSNEKLQHWVGDYMVKLPRTKEGYDSILVLVDRVTRYVLLVACAHTCTAADLSRILQDSIGIYGPKTLIFDKDSRITSAEIKQFVKAANWDLRVASTDHHETVGLAERAIRTIKDHLRRYVDATQINWREFLLAVQQAMNNSHCESIGCTPMYLVHGLDPRRPEVSYQPPEGHDHHAEWVRTEKKARDQLEKARERMVRSANKKRYNITYRVGDQVLLSNRNPWFKTLDGVRKLQPLFVGPFPVTHITNAVTLTLRLPEEMLCGKQFHVSLVKPYHPDTRYQHAEPELREDGEFFEVEAILGKREFGRGKILQYKVAFVGYGPVHNKWLPVECLDCAPQIEEFEVRLAANIGSRAVAHSTKKVRNPHSRAIFNDSEDYT